MRSSEEIPAETVQVHFKTEQIESLQETYLPMGWLTAVDQTNSHKEEKQFVQGVERIILLEENPAQLDYPNALMW